MRISKKQYNEIVSRLESLEKTLNKGGGNPNHDPRNGQFTSGPGGSKGESAKESESRSWYDDGNFGTAPMVIDEKDGKYKVKSFGDESATRGLLGADSALSQVANLPYEKSIKGERPTEKQQMVFQQVTAIRQLLQQKVGEMGDVMSYKDKKFDFDDFDTTMSHVDEYLHKAKLGTVGDKSKVGEALSKALTRLSNVTGMLKMIADPDMLKKHGEAQWYDIDSQIKRRKNSLGSKADNLIDKMDKIINGGKGSGNFGHSGRLGKVGGSGKWQGKRLALDRAIDTIRDSSMGSYSDGFDTMERAKEYLVDHIGEGEIGEYISMAYEDSVRDLLDLPSMEQEREGAEISMADLLNIQGEMGELIRAKSFDDLESDLGPDAIGVAIDCALMQGGIEYALDKAEASQGKAAKTTTDLEQEIKDFMVDFGLTDRYDVMERAKGGDSRTAWKDLSLELRDKLKDEYNYDIGKKELK